MTVRLTHVGGPTLLVEVDGWRLLTDPTFDAPGRRYGFGWGTAANKTTAPAVAADALGRVDAVLLSHHGHADNLDDAGRAYLPSVPAVVTTPAAARALALPGARGLTAWETTTLVRTDEAGVEHRLEVTATPSRHGPPGTVPIVGASTGFAVRVPGEPRHAVWVTGDSVLYGGLREAAERLEVDVLVLHLGAVRFGITGPMRFTMNASEGVELVGRTRPRAAAFVHTEGWSHFTQGPDEAARVVAAAPADVRDLFRPLTLGEPVDVA
ncbi:MBL fold metallo-hydrolase [Cellulomonas composti]|uniref:MBL fold metallo-hydrolase n=1 Tax=Cellulomonas composti TaxID=266130 RepID=A0A511JC90_9CELL|nr:MBL fold metallo-hydrolase [Cellulomonas composti]GEL95611.1 MBL fold metallo-hydrolase [Cellulomonas composti]